MAQDDHRPHRTADVARESGYSLQQVRDLERLGVIPPAARGANGYRSYAPVHVQALRAYRGLASAAGPVAARHLLAGLFTEPRTGSLADAASAVGAVHVRLARERDEALRAQDALSAIRAEMIEPDGVHAAEHRTAGHDVATHSSTEHSPTEHTPDTMTITELAAALGVRTSTLRFWEQAGLAVPARVTTQRARQYGPAAIREARIVAALRGSGYGIPAVRDVVATLQGRTGVTDARRILDRRLDQIAARTVALLRAGADLADVLESESLAGPPGVGLPPSPEPRVSRR